LNILYTFGYTGIEPQEILEAAQRISGTVADIRISPRSRHPQWDGRTLAEAWGRCYVHIPQLGNKNYKGQYGTGIMLANPQAGRQLVLAHLTRGPVMLMCACPSWETCHRRDAAEYILQSQPNLEVIHLTADALRALGKPVQFSLF